MKYECKLCNFKTNDLHNLTRHEGTIKHKDNQSKFNKRSTARQKTIQAKLDASKADNDKLVAKLVDAITTMCNMHSDVMKGQIEVSKTQAITTSKSMSAIKYLSKYRTTAPVVKPLKGTELTKMITYKGSKYYTLADVVIHNYKHKILHKFFGDMIIDKYKTDEPDDQSVWLSDLSRLSFIIRELKDGNPEWVTDKSGNKLIKLIISPMMKKVKEMLLENISDLNNKNNEGDIDDVEIKENVQTMEKTNEIIRDINMNKFNAAILKYIAPEFNLDIK